MTNGHPIELLAAYALDALFDGERDVVRAHVQACERCRREVSAFRAVTEVLDLSVSLDVAPRSDLRDRILQASAQTPQIRRPPTPIKAPRRLGWTIRLGGWLAAAALFITTLGLGAWNVDLQTRLQAISTRSIAQVPLVATTDAPGATGDLAVENGRGTVVTVANLPPPGPVRVYEVWVIDASGPHPAGTFVTTPDGRGAVVLTRPAAPGQIVAITAEPIPGTEKPTGKVLLKATALSS